MIGGKDASIWQKSKTFLKGILKQIGFVSYGMCLNLKTLFWPTSLSCISHSYESKVKVAITWFMT
jgi:hypothetical protein